MEKIFIYKLPKGENIFDYKNNVIQSNVINRPRISLGFQSFIHSTKDKCRVFEKHKNNKIYLIVNNFETNIPEYESSLNNVMTKYINSNVISRAFFKMWEILILFDIANNDKLRMVGLAEGPGSFIQAVLNYRLKILDKNIKNDKVKGITLFNKILNFNEKFVNDINKKYGKVIETYNSSEKDNCDLTKEKTMKKCIKWISNFKADLVTADGGFVWKDENYQEQEAYKLVLGEICSAVHICDKGGTFVLKIFDTFTDITLKYISILEQFFEDIYLHKPYMSRQSNSERYLICKNFKFNDTDKKYMEYRNKLVELFDNIDDSKFVNDIFTDFKINEKLQNSFKYINIQIMNTQFEKINNMITYLNKNNYFGEDYHNYRDKQIEATNFWVKNFMPPSVSTYKSIRSSLTNEMKEEIEHNRKKIEFLTNSLV